MRQVETGSTGVSVRPVTSLAAIAAFLVVYLAGLAREQPLLWVAVSAALALLVVLGAGLVIERILSVASGGGDRKREPAAVYEPGGSPPARQDEEPGGSP